jgi:hypothetical protein
VALSENDKWQVLGGCLRIHVEVATIHPHIQLRAQDIRSTLGIGMRRPSSYMAKMGR